ncbi:MAG: hypothetical protein IPK27_08330 [Rhodanobacteraceae bacterium]|nr:hypothetical protein [Rhodanobacteraceae bacterium]
MADVPQQYVHALSNRGNGFARLDLEYVEALRTMVVRISADDQNLDPHSLEYQLESGGVWTGNPDGTEAVDDQVIGSH